MNIKLVALATAVAFLVVILVSLDRVAPYRYDEVHLDRRFLPPSPSHPFGTDSLGRDVFTRILYGFRLSLALSSLSLAISATLGSAIGILSALSRRLYIVVDLLLSFFYIVPSIFIAAVVAFTAGFGIHVVAVAISLRFLPMFYRIARTVALSVSVEPYIESARTLGASTSYILTHYIARETLPVVTVTSIYSFPDAISMEVSLNIIGLGVQPPTPSLGNILAEGVRYIAIAPHIIAASIATIFTTILVVDSIGRKIEEYLKENRVYTLI